jgi:hypothetical protein
MKKEIHIRFLRKYLKRIQVKDSKKRRYVSTLKMVVIILNTFHNYKENLVRMHKMSIIKRH